MAFPAAFLDELSARNPIEEVVGQYVSLTRKGGNLFGLCPFHSEKTGSFSVAPEKGIYYCFGCHKGGSVIQFVMDIENLDYPDAVRFLAKRANMDVPEDAGRQSTFRRQERLQTLCRDAARYFHSCMKSEAGAPARAYFVKRALSPQTVTRFGLGFAPDGWTGLLDELTAKGYTKQDILDAGLASVHQTKGSIYDRFRNRVMFPIFDVRDNVIGFGGRVMDDSKPKYLNSPETLIFNKRKNLFGLNIAKKSREGFLILTEGYMDTIALHQYGFDCAVASLGTALTEEHARLLAKYTQKVVLIYDGDAAGQNATHRATPMLEKAGLSVRILRMEGAKDPDEFLRAYGADAFRALLQKSENPSEYRLIVLRGKYDVRQDDQRVAFLREAADYIASLPSAVEREVYGTRAAETAGVSPQAMKAEIDHAYRRREAAKRKKQTAQDLAAVQSRQPLIRGIRYENVRSAMAEEALLRAISRDPELLRDISLTAQQFSSPLLGRAYDALRAQWESGTAVGIAGFGEAFSKEEMQHLSYVLQKSSDPIRDDAVKDYIQVIEHECGSRGSSGEARLQAALRQKRQNP